MSAQPESSDRRTAALPRTINAIGDALSGEKRARFYGEVLAAEQGPQLDGVMTRWWMDAMLDRAPGREERYADALAGRRLVPLPKPTDAG